MSRRHLFVGNWSMSEPLLRAFMDSDDEVGAGQITRATEDVPTLRIRGPLVNGGGLLAALMGAVEYDHIVDAIQAIDAAGFAAMVLDVDSVGGDVDGVQAVRRAIANTKAHVTLRATGNWCSAAVWAFSGADRIEVEPTATGGSLGVMHIAGEQDGSDVTVYRSPRAQNKNAAHDSEVGLSQIETTLADIEAVMLGQIAADRGLDPDEMAKAFNYGGTLTGQRIVDAGLADGLVGQHQNDNSTAIGRPTGGQVVAKTKEGTMPISYTKAEGLSDGQVIVALSDLKALNAVATERDTLKASLEAANNKAEQSAAALATLKASVEAKEQAAAEAARVEKRDALIASAEKAGRVGPGDVNLKAQLVAYGDALGNEQLATFIEALPKQHAAGEPPQGHGGNPEPDGDLSSKAGVVAQIKRLAASDFKGDYNAAFTAFAKNPANAEAMRLWEE